MGYLKEFQTHIANRDLTKFLELWDEYCTCDTLDIEELHSLFQAIKASDFVKSFGQHIEKILPLWLLIESEEESYRTLRQIMDLQTTNSPQLADLAIEAIKKKHGQDRDFQDRLRLVGLRTKENFQSALSHFDLLAHIKKGNFVFHPGGWGVGEIMDHSTLREQMVVEFENVSGLKHITYSNAFKTLIPLPQEHFLARRFSNPDLFEKEAKENPIEVIKILLRDLGPKTAAEIKDELSGLVIPEEEWQKWWQNTRAKLKKDTSLISPENPRDPFLLRKEAVSHEDQFLESLHHHRNIKNHLLYCYNFIRDHAGKAKLPEIRKAIADKLQPILEENDVSDAEKLQVYFCLELLQEGKYQKEITEIIASHVDLEQLLDQIEILSFKKQALHAIKMWRNNWHKAFISLLHTIPQSPLRDYLFKELLQSPHRADLEKALKNLLEHPDKDPEFFFWYFLKLVNENDPSLPYGDKKGVDQFAESCLVLLNRIENLSIQKDLVKRIYNAFAQSRYALVRKLFEGSSLEFVKEFLLLASKCHTFSDADRKIFQSLGAVVHLSLEDKRKKKSYVDHTLWTTEKGYYAAQERIKQIGTKEIVDNAREIEAARALGDLRENAEYKYALERRSQLQRELKRLSEQFSKARVITPNDVSEEEVGVGSVVELENKKGTAVSYTILGAWEADAEANILSLQSPLAQAMIGLHANDQFKFREDEFKISRLSTIFSKS
jgi:transcription elongation factor GreA-like protein/transcription elongation GreA/GreB family factor